MQALSESRCLSMSSVSSARDELLLLLHHNSCNNLPHQSVPSRPLLRSYPSVSAKIFKGGKKVPEKDYPWPKNLRGDHKDHSLSFLSRFKPLPEKPKSFTLPFERPLVDLSTKIDEAIPSSHQDLCIHLLSVYHHH